jgi:hypothetical protein
MLFKYKLAVIVLVQFILLSLLGIANGINSVVTECSKHDGDCLSNTIVSLVFFLLTAAWFAFIWVLGYTAEERRSKGLLRLLIAAEGMTALVALFNAQHHENTVGLITSLLDLVLALWVILLAIRLLFAKGGRVVTKQRTRARRRPTERL